MPSPKGPRVATDSNGACIGWLLSMTRGPAEMADAFKELGVRGLIATRLDIARRIGAVLTAAATGDFDLLAFTADASVAEPPRPFNAVALARILLPDDYVRDAAPAPAPLWQSRRPA